MEGRRTALLMKLGAFQRMIIMFQEAFKELNVDVPMQELEPIVIMIHHAMTLQGRSFHTPDHIFTVAESLNPVQCVAALFHDIVYYQVDQGFTREITAIMGPYVGEIWPGTFRIRKASEDDHLFCLTLDIFGFEEGQELSPTSGLNEFLSALVMMKTLGSIIPERVLLTLSACIEATIPFRPDNAQGESNLDILEQRLLRMNQKYDLNLQQQYIEEIVQWAVVLSNNDVSSFSQTDPGKFLDDTWKLLPETNFSLRRPGIYTIRAYREALQKMTGFFKFLTPTIVFKRYKGVPSQIEYQKLVDQAQANLNIALEYLATKLLTIAVLEALAELTGGDAPLALFMGDIKVASDDVKRLESFLPSTRFADDVDESSAVFNLLENGRTSATSFDLQNAPLAIHLYKILGPGKISELSGQVDEFLKQEMSPEAFLQHIGHEVIAPVARACAAMALTRGDKLIQLAGK